MKKSLPKISIITVCYNSVATITDTIASIAKQDYENIEHIIVDGGSTDGTVEIIANSPSVTRYISERDKGIYDAMNKGIAMASGDIIGTLNADDFYENNDVLKQVSAVFDNPEVDACYGDLVYVQQKDTDKVVRYWKSESFKSGLFKHGWMPAHPTFFVRRELYEKYGDFNLDYKIAADVELLFRFLEVNKINSVYLPAVLVKMRLGGTTNQNFFNIRTQNQEVIYCLDQYYGRVSRFSFFIGKILNRLKQFLTRPVVN